MLGIVSSFFVLFCKIINYRAITALKILGTLLFTVCISFLYAVVLPIMPIPFIITSLAVSGVIFIYILTRLEFNLVVSALLIALCMSYVFYLISVTLIALLALLIFGDIYSYILYTSFVLVFQLILVWQFIRIRRFKNGFPFLLKRYTIIISLILAGIVLLGVTLIVNSRDDLYLFSILLGILICGVGIVIWIRRGITMFYRRKIKEHNIEIMEEQLNEKDAEIERLAEQNNMLRIANHKINKRFSALEQTVMALSYNAMKGAGSEPDAEYADVLEQVRAMAAEYEAEVNKIPATKPLPVTGIKTVDSLFEYFSKFASPKGIDFNLKINGSINYMIQNVIDRVKLETIIGDHVQDAVIAVDAGSNKFRSILVILGIGPGCYELTIFDSGVEFEIDTLMKLGVTRVTTYSDKGGSGIGFMTTFEILREHSASLIIEEKPVSDSDYTKSVTVRFDGKGQYIIKTYRAALFPSQNDRKVEIYDTGA